MSRRDASAGGGPPWSRDGNRCILSVATYLSNPLNARISPRFSGRLALAADQVCEVLELLLIQIRHHPAIHPCRHQLFDVVSMFGLHSRRAGRVAGRGPHEDIDHVLAM